MSIDIKETYLSFNSLSERPYTDMIVIHHTGSPDVDASAEEIHGWHLSNGWSGIGYHFVIRKDGVVERGRPEWAIGSHAYGENGHTIGIHLSGDFSAVKPTDDQVEKCAMLIADICERYGIKIDRGHIVGHGELMATDCPGDNLQVLLDDGTIIGKAIWWFNKNNGITNDEVIEQDQGKQGGRSLERFNTIESIPDWARPTIKKLIDKGLLNGTGDNLDLSLDMIRMFVINDRANLY